MIGASHSAAPARVLARETARAIIADAPCAVAVAPAGYAGRTRLETIGVGYDRSLGSQQALDVARRLAAERHATLSGFEAVRPARRAIRSTPGRRLHSGSRPHGNASPRWVMWRHMRNTEGAPSSSPGSVPPWTCWSSVHTRRPGTPRRPHIPLALRLAHAAPCPVLVVASPLPVAHADR